MVQPSSQWQREVDSGKRFRFGRNWARFIEAVDEQRIDVAQQSLRERFGMERMDGMRFCDVGCGSGLFSLAARRLGAEVVSFDYDADSVTSTKTLRQQWSKEDDSWVIEQSSILERSALSHLGTFDIVYSWGVLHHTGAMWDAMENVAMLVKPGGLLFIAIYNDQGWKSSMWRRVKQLYCSSGMGRWAVLGSFSALFAVYNGCADLLRMQNPLRRYRGYGSERGMTPWRDWVDWFGGLPFEVATPERVESFYRQRGFDMIRVERRNTLGCNEFVMRLSTPGDDG